MAALVMSRKRDLSMLSDDPHHPSPLSKRICPAAAYSLPRSSGRSGGNNGSTGRNSGDSGDGSPPLARLMALFPDLDPQLLKRAIEASGNNVDSAVKSLTQLRSVSAEKSSGSSASISSMGMCANVPLSSEGTLGDCHGETAEHPLVTENLPTDGSGWVELLVTEMLKASNMDDAKAHASRALELLEKSIVTHASTEATQRFHEENKMLKEQVASLLHDNSILKRAVAIQHGHQKDYETRGQELEHLKQMVSQYQEKLRTLEVNNYALAMHLRQVQQDRPMPGSFHPDIF